MTESAAKSGLNLPHICTIGELAQKTGISAYTIRQWVKQKEFNVLRSGKKYLINYDVFIKFLQGDSEIPAAPQGIRKVAKR